MKPSALSTRTVADRFPLGVKLLLLSGVLLSSSGLLSVGYTAAAFTTSFSIPGHAVTAGVWSAIIAPELDATASGSLELLAFYADDNGDGNDGVQWAVRAGTCAAGVNTQFGNVDGFATPYTWNGADFSAIIDTTTVEDGPYCFIFNPSEDAGDMDQRLTRNFSINNVADQVVLNELYPAPVVATTSEPFEREWVEVYNGTDSIQSISGWSVQVDDTPHEVVAVCADEPNTLQPYGTGTTLIAPDGLVVLEFCSNGAQNKMPNDGATVTLLDDEDVEYDEYTYGATAHGKAHARIPDGATWVDPAPTPGKTNTVTVQDLLNEGWTLEEIAAVREAVVDFAEYTASLVNDVTVMPLSDAPASPSLPMAPASPSDDLLVPASPSSGFSLPTTASGSHDGDLLDDNAPVSDSFDDFSEDNPAQESDEKGTVVDDEGGQTGASSSEGSDNEDDADEENQEESADESVDDADGDTDTDTESESDGDEGDQPKKEESDNGDVVEDESSDDFSQDDDDKDSSDDSADGDSGSEDDTGAQGDDAQA